ncbi:MAG: sigma-70 family RNA polymerase sigma factor [Planctomycetota bacterium]|jgi:RNA polymerase sigma-70 factor (ECF subfamily)
MPIPDSTCWDVIVKAAGGDDVQREEFVRRYTPIVVEYLGARWQGTPLMAEVGDAAHEVFVECFRQSGVLERADPSRPGGFRAFFFGVIRNVSRRVEDARGRNRELQQSTGYDPDEREIALETSASRVLDRAWARTILNQAGARYREAAGAEGEEALRRVELLRLRFEEGLPIREIASRWNMDPELLHQQYRRARREFRRHLEAELDFHGASEADKDRQWQEFISLLQ